MSDSHHQEHQDHQEHQEHHGHEEDNSVNVKVALFFTAVLVSIFIIAWIN